jgi:hypothetical protein
MGNSIFMRGQFPLQDKARMARLGAYGPAPSGNKPNAAPSAQILGNVFRSVNAGVGPEPRRAAVCADHRLGHGRAARLLPGGEAAIIAAAASGGAAALEPASAVWDKGQGA